MCPERPCAVLIAFTRVSGNSRIVAMWRPAHHGVISGDFRAIQNEFRTFPSRLSNVDLMLRSAAAQRMTHERIVGALMR